MNNNFTIKAPSEFSKELVELLSKCNKTIFLFESKNQVKIITTKKNGIKKTI